MGRMRAGAGKTSSRPPMAQGKPEYTSSDPRRTACFFLSPCFFKTLCCITDGNVSALFDQSIKSVSPYPISAVAGTQKALVEVQKYGGTPIPMPSQLIAVAWPEHDILYPFSFLGWLSEGKRNSRACSAYLPVCPDVCHAHQKPLNPPTVFSKT